jgi:hypothetical protein
VELPRQGAVPPTARDRHQGDPVAERDDPIAGVEQDAGDEPVAEAVREPPQVARVARAHGGAPLDLDGGDPPVGPLEADVDLTPVARPQVRQRVPGGAGRGELAAEFVHHEARAGVRHAMGRRPAGRR